MTTTLSDAPPAGCCAPATASDPALVVDARKLSEAVSELIRVVQFRDRDRACCHDVSVSQCYALKGIVDAGGMSINDVAAHLYLDKSTASRIANGLVTRGLLDRERDTTDGRIVRLIATAEGRRIKAAIERDLEADYAQMLEDFDPDIRSAVADVVTRLGASFASRVDTSGGSCCVVGQE